MNITTTNLISARKVQKTFTKDQRQELLVLDNINFEMPEGEIVALLGKSGCGKSTLLRIFAGLAKASKGDVLYRGDPIYGPVRGIAMVFQHFALMPWLTVFQNVELGLEAQGIARAERRERALQAIDVIGLDGFESAYPKELSGGMRQRVGFARALVVNPSLLLMDEPFSALDVLTAENLKSDLIDLWQEKKTQLGGILFVTHSIEEAVELADRIIILNGEPSYIQADLSVEMAHPRNSQDPSFRKLVDDIYTLMTTRPGQNGPAIKKEKAMHLGYRLPDVDISELTGLLETLEEEEGGRMDLPELAEVLHLDIDDLFPLTEMLELLRFAKVSQGDITITQAGHTFVHADILEKKKLFSMHLMRYVPLVKHICRILDERHGHRAAKGRFLNELEDFLSEEEAERVLKVVIDWGRYAELFAYDDNSGTFSLENPS